MAGVITPTLHTDVLVAALISEAAAERAVVPRTSASACIGERRDYAIFFHSFSGILGSRLSLATSFAPAGCLEGLSLSFASSRACLRRASCLSRRARSFFVRASEVGGRVGGENVAS